MPPSTRLKRVFDEISANSQSEPAPKKASTAKPKAKDNNMTRAKIVSKKPVKPKPSSQKAAPTKSKTVKVAANADPKTWICICEKAVQHRCNVSSKCMCMTSAEENGKHKWILTKAGADLHQQWLVEQMKRDADVFDVITYNDYSGYGTGEVVENMLCAFDTAINSTEKDTWMIWAHIQGMARFLSQENLKWYSIDDSETNGKRVMLIGTAILTSIDHLIDGKVFNNNSEIRNIGFIIALLLQFVVEFEETCTTNEDGWRFSVLKRADQYNVTIRGSYNKNFDAIMASIRNDRDDNEHEEEGENSQDDDGADERPNYIRAYDAAPYDPAPTYGVPELGVNRSWDAYDWKQELAAFTKLRGVDGKIGGNHYDLTVERSEDSDASDGWEDEAIA